MRILTDMPMKGKYVNWNKTIGMTIEVEHKDYGNVGFKVIDYIPNINRLFLDYNGYVLKGGINTSCFLKGRLGSVMNFTKASENKFQLDEENILHIYDKNGKWEVLYSGKYIKEVMNSTWSVNKKNIQTGNYNFEGKQKYLHHVDVKPKSHMVIDHISNPYNLIDKFYDNRIENLREVTMAENNKNKKCRNEWGYTGLVKKRNGWYSAFSYNGKPICTKTKHDFNEVILDNLIAQRYLGYKHQEEEFYKLDELLEERIKDVTDFLDIKMKKSDDKIHEIKEYEYDIEQKDDYYILKKNGHEMLFDCDSDLFKNKCIYPIKESNGIYWLVAYIENNQKIQNRFHRDILGFKPNEYLEYQLHIDHINNNPSDNRFYNLSITTNYSNHCNVKGKGYRKLKPGSYMLQYMSKYRFFSLIGGIKKPTFKTEQEAIDEIERRKTIVESSRVKLKSKQELEELIQYCLDNQYILENGLADLDLGYLYLNGILKTEKVEQTPTYLLM